MSPKVHLLAPATFAKACGMHQKMPSDARHCLRRAFESRCCAEAATLSSEREFWLSMERRWLLLAEGCDCARRTDAFLSAFRQRRPRHAARERRDPERRARLHFH
jgi:hypothetical protein